MDDSWKTDLANPWNWTNRKKIIHTLIVAWIAFTCTLGTSIYAPGHAQVAAEFNTSRTVSTLPISLYILGLGCGPAIAAPSSETFGRKAVYLAFMPIFALFTLGAGFSKSIASLCVCRLFAGIFASPGMALATATVSDIWPLHQRAIPMAAYAACPFIGPLGPLIGSFVVQERNWRWTQWVLLFASVFVLVGALSMKETYKRKILKSRAKKDPTEHDPTTEDAQTHSRIAGIRAWMTTSLTRPIHMLVTEPIIGFLTLYVTVQFGVLYTFYTVTPTVFAIAFGFDLGQQGLTYIGMTVAVVLSFCLLIRWSQFIYRPRVVRWRADETRKNTPPPPEWRLLPAVVASPLLPGGLFLFGWTARPDYPWICPVLGMAFFIAGTYTTFMSVTMYITDCYGPKYGASAIAGNTMLRYSVGGMFPLFALQMFSGLGVGWASSLLGFLSLALALFPSILLRYGPRLRRRQSYVNSN